MKKVIINKLFLYRYRFLIGYILLSLAFISLLLFLPLIVPNGLSKLEMQSSVNSYQIGFHSFWAGDITDLPYRVLQKLSILLFGLTPYSIKLPSIIIGLLLGVLLILLLNRWFKSNVALLASILTVLSSAFLYLTGSGTPLIMYVFWPTLLLWLGSKIQGAKITKPFYCFSFAIILLLSIFTPYMIYLAAFIFLYAILNPHLRHTIKNLPKIPFIFTALLILVGLVIFGINLINYPTNLSTIFASEQFSLGNFFNNIKLSLLPFFSWSGKIESHFLAPLIGLATLALAVTGLISTTNGFFASRNSIASYLIIYTLLISGFNPNCAVLLILPLSILVAHGFRYILEKWYGLFPANPYARIFGILPIGIILGIIIISDLSHYVFGYRYNPPVANNFHTDLALLHKNLQPGDTLLVGQDQTDFEFYKLLGIKNPQVSITQTLPKTTSTRLVTLGKPAVKPKKAHLNRIISSAKSQNSDRIYMYTVK